MTLEIKPFTAADVEAAAGLLAERQRRLRLSQPLLPDRYEATEVTRPLLESLLQTASGVAASSGGQMTGYLLGAPSSGWGLRMTLVPFAGQSVADLDDVELYRLMYAAASPQWIKQGFFVHSVDLAAEDNIASDAWFSLGFGSEIEMGLKEANGSAPHFGEGHIEQAGPAEIEPVQHLMQGLGRFNSLPPIFRPFVPPLDQWASFLPRLLEQLENAEHSFWLAYEGAEPVGLMIFTPPEQEELMFSPERSAYISIAYVQPQSRASGIGGALLDRGLAWAQARGNAYCTAGWFSANLPGAGFWRSKGFTPLAQRLQRHIDERIAWATAEG